MSFIELQDIKFESIEMKKILSEIDKLIEDINVNEIPNIIFQGPVGSEIDSLAVYIQKKLFNQKSIHLNIYELNQMNLKNNGIFISINNVNSVDEVLNCKDKNIVISLSSINLRKEDLIPLSLFLVEMSCLINQKTKKTLSEKAKEKIINSFWINELDQLEQVIDKAVCNSTRLIIEPEDLNCSEIVNDLNFSIGQKLENVERQYILQTLYFVEQNRTRAAEVLGISIRTLRNKLNQYRQEGYL